MESTGFNSQAEGFLREQEKLLRHFANSTLSDSPVLTVNDLVPSYPVTMSDIHKQQGGYLHNSASPSSIIIMPSTGYSSETDEDDSTFIVDPEMIEEQRRILEQIKQQNQHHGTSSQTHPSTPRTGDGAAWISLEMHVDDQVIKTGMQNLRVKGTRYAYESIAQGSAVIVQCSICQAILQVSSIATNLYCTACRQLTPMEQALNVSACRAGATDKDIARKVQFQEICAASSMKTRALLQGGTANVLRPPGAAALPMQRLVMVPRQRMRRSPLEQDPHY